MVKSCLVLCCYSIQAQTNVQSGDIRYCPTWGNPTVLNNATIITGTTITTNTTPTSANSIVFQGDAILEFNGTDAVNFGSSTDAGGCANTQAISTPCDLPWGTFRSSPNTVAIKNLSTTTPMEITIRISFGIPSARGTAANCYDLSYSVRKNGSAIVTKTVNFSRGSLGPGETVLNTGSSFSDAAPYPSSCAMANPIFPNPATGVYTYTFTNNASNGDQYSVIINSVRPQNPLPSTCRSTNSPDGDVTSSSYVMATLTVLPFF